jgi:tetratricopeptide (TPR) repeat protein
MARAAVKAKQAQKAKAAPPKQRQRPSGRRRHAAGGNPNQQLFFVRMRRNAKPVYLILAVLFAVTFAFLGVGSGTNGLDQLFSGLNIFRGSKNSVSHAQKEIKDHPNQAKGYRDLATAYEAKGDTANAISALQQYTVQKPKDAKAFAELGGLQLTQAGDYQTQYQNAYTARQLAAPGQAFLPTGKLATAIGTDQIEAAAAQQAQASVTDLQQRTQLAYSNAVSSFQSAAKLRPHDANSWFQLAQTAQQSGDYTTAISAYKRYLKINPDSTSASQIEQLIKELSKATGG